MAHTCRGTISLHGAHIHTEDSCNFIVSNGGGTQTFHLRASTEVERQRWVTALELAKAKGTFFCMLASSFLLIIKKGRHCGDEGRSFTSVFSRNNLFFFFVTAIQRMESEDDESIMGADNDGELGNEIDKAELNNVIKTLGSKLEDLQTCHDLIVKHGLALQRSLNELESSSARYFHFLWEIDNKSQFPFMILFFFSAKIMTSTKLHPSVQETLDAILILVMTIASKSKL